MFGKIEILKAAISIISLLSLFADLKFGKIYNWITVPSLILGLGFSSFFGGLNGLEESLLGIFTGLLLYGWMFALRLMGGGDVKLLMALGAWGGFHFSADVAILAIFIGGVISFIILVIKGKFIHFIRKFYNFFLILSIRDMDPQLPKLDRTLTLPFGVPIGIAAVWTVLAFPLEHWGFIIWR